MRSVRATLSRPSHAKPQSHSHTLSIRSPALSSRRLRVSGSSSRRSPALLPAPILLSLRCAIVLVVLWFEYLTFWSHARVSCPGFDDSPALKGRIWDPSLGLNGGWTANTQWQDATRGVQGQGYHVLVVADPQLLDMRAYPDRSALVRWLGVKFTDLYARKSWRQVRKIQGRDGRGIDAVVWLGDLLDEGRKAEDPHDYAEYVRRFRSTFPPPRRPATRSAVPVVHLPGNHDLGLHPSSSSLGSAARERFKTAFGPLQGKIEEGWAGWEVVWIDSMALLEGDEAGGKEARAWVEKLGLEETRKPRLLLTHIPLFRPEGTRCGPGRESARSLRQGQGQDYQNEMDETTSKWLMDRIKPSIVYSGDDHDLCIVRHSQFAPDSGIPVVETTVKAFSMAMGVRLPGFHLLTLYPPLDSSSPSSATCTQVNCTLPDQLGIWFHVYLPLIAIIVASFLFPKLYKRALASAQGAGGRSRRGLSSARSNGLPVARYTSSNGGGVSNGNSNGHGHKRSLSEKLLGTAASVIGGGGGGGNGGAKTTGLDPLDLAEDQDSQFPTFPFDAGSQGGEQYGYGYHAGLDSDQLPTGSAANGVTGDGGGSGNGWTTWDDVESRQPKNVRRVSRVWLWDGGSSDEEGDGDGDGTANLALTNRGRYGRGPSSSSVTGSNSLDVWLARRLGPLWAVFLRPALRIGWAVLALPRRVLRIGSGRSSSDGGGGSGMLATTFRQVNDVVWPGVMTWCVINWVWFGLLA